MQSESKVKVPKVTSKKLPDVFRSGKSGGIGRKIADPQSLRQPLKQGRRQAKGSCNPFLPMKQYLGMLNKINKDIQDASQFNFDKFQRHSPVLHRRYEDCVTISVVSGSNTTRLKKMLHVPTLTVHFMRESLIHEGIDRSDIASWMDTLQPHPNCLRVVQLFWNIPQHYYSLLYQYSQGVSFQYLLCALNSFPPDLLSTIAAPHLHSNLAIFNSQLILNGQQGCLFYLPLYQDCPMKNKRLEEIIESECVIQGDDVESKLVWRLGALLLTGFLGEIILDEDLRRVQVPLQQCCLLHELLAMKESLTTIMNSIEVFDSNVVQFLCLSLSSKRGTTLRKLRNCELVTKKTHGIVSLAELVSVVDPTSSIKCKFQLTNMNKIMNSIGLTLQNISGVPCELSFQHKGIIQFAREIGMGNDVRLVLEQLQKVYKGEKLL